jgi:hypothetical protein
MSIAIVKEGIAESRIGYLAVDYRGAVNNDIAPERITVAARRTEVIERFDLLRSDNAQ